MTVLTRRQSADDNMSRALTGQSKDAKSFASAKDCRGGYCKVQVALHFLKKYLFKTSAMTSDLYHPSRCVLFQVYESMQLTAFYRLEFVSFCVDLFLFDEPASIDYTGPVFLSQYARPVFRVDCFALLLIQRCNSLSKEYFLLCCWPSF